MRFKRKSDRSNSDGNSGDLNSVFQSDRVHPILYMDEKLLEKFYLQIGTGQVDTTTKQVGTDWSLVGPTAKFQQVQGTRPATPVDKIRSLQAFLKENGQLGFDRFRGNDRDPEERSATFRLERFAGRRVLLKDASQQPALSLWFSRQEPAGWMTLLLLLEAVPDSAAASEFYSSFSYLSQLLMSLAPQLIQVPPFSQSYSAAQEQGVTFEKWTDAITHDIVIDPAGFFLDGGADMFPERSIEAFYWIRRAFTHPYSLDGCRITIGYPIYVAEVEPEALEKNEPYHNQVGLLTYTEREIEKYASVTREKALARGATTEEAEAEAQEKRKVYSDLAKSLSGRSRMLTRSK